MFCDKDSYGWYGIHDLTEDEISAVLKALADYRTHLQNQVDAISDPYIRTIMEQAVSNKIHTISNMELKIRGELKLSAKIYKS